MTADMYDWLVEALVSDLSLIQVALLCVGLDLAEVALLVSHRTSFDSTRTTAVGELVQYFGLPFCLCVLVRTLTSLSFLVVIQPDRNRGGHDLVLLNMLAAGMRVLAVVSKAMAFFILAMSLMHQGGREMQLLLGLHGLTVLFLVPVYWALRRRVHDLRPCLDTEEGPEVDLWACSRILEESLEEACVICLEPLAKGEAVSTLPCAHSFHRPCLETWLRKSASCPLRCALSQEVVLPEELGAPEEQEDEGIAHAQRQADQTRM